MKGISSLDKVNLTQFDVNVNPYLTYDQIGLIADAMHQYETWPERMVQRDMLVLLLATDVDRIETDKGENKTVKLTHTHQEYLTSGLIDQVREAIVNFDDIQKALDYMESTSKALTQILRRLPDYMKPLEKVMKKYEKPEGK